MTRQATFHRLAEVELFDAAQYYLSVEPILAERFVAAVEEARDQLLIHPEMAPLVSRGVRRKIVNGFPYAVFYSIQAEGIRILAIGHQRRRPSFWRGRR